MPNNNFVMNVSPDLQNVIQSFDNWSMPFDFSKYVLSSPHLTEDSRLQFKIIWETAVDSNNWKDVDLVLGCKIAQNRLELIAILSENAIACIVRAASYEWR